MLNPLFQLEAIEQTGVDLEVFAAIYSVADDDHVAYRRQRDLIRDAIQTYGADHIAGITVGNEFMLKWALILFSGMDWKN